MSKKIWISLVAIILLVSFGGFFYWQKYIKETPPEEWGEANFASVSDFIVQDISNKKVVENKKVGLKIELPENWTIKEPTFSTDSFQALSPNSIEKNNMLMEKGCKLTINIINIRTDIETIQEEIQKNWGRFIETIMPIEKAGYKGIVYNVEPEKWKTSYKEIAIPIKGRVYSLILNSAIKDKQFCFEIFDEISDSFSVK